MRDDKEYVIPLYDERIREKFNLSMCTAYCLGQVERINEFGNRCKRYNMTFKEAWNQGNKKMRALFVFAVQGLLIDVAIAIYIIFKISQ
jgi:hypothetical protein